MKRVRRLLREPIWIPLRSGPLHISMRHWPLLLIWVILTAFAFQTERDIFFRLSYLILAVIFLSFLWAAYSVFTFQLERRLVTPRTQVGRVAEELFLVRNSGALAKIWMEVRDESELPGHRVGRVLNGLQAGVRWSWNVRTLCRQRGRFHLGPITLASGDPFGLFVFQRRLPNTAASLTVYPMAVDLPVFAPPMGHLSGGDTQRRRTHHTTTNVVGTREYAPGDSFNRIHWRSTARTDRLIVKEFELDPSADVWVFLDMERGVQASKPLDDGEDLSDLGQMWFGNQRTRLTPSTEEYDVSIAATVARYYLRQHRAVGLVAYGHHRELIQPDRGDRQLNRLLEVLAVLRAEGNLPFSHVLGVESAHLGRNITVVTVCPSADLEWIKTAREAKRRGLRVISVLTDINTFGGRGETKAAASELFASGIPNYVVREGDDLRGVLGQWASGPTP
ncbi:MAG: DUF58 domain-containing protein [Chloroflexi bacterium]|nr:DUF58 domain-containing protein [Chloroflexota bacterium]MCL5952345.1 DUF58 domain-containing protein [Chloroflexota bacterium]